MPDSAVSSHAALADTARRVLPGGTFGGVSFGIVIAEGRGGRVTDIAGKTYIDFLLGSGPMLLGHAHPDVTAAVAGQLAKGATFYANNEAGIRLAAEIVDAVPCAKTSAIHLERIGSNVLLHGRRLTRPAFPRCCVERC